MSCSAFERSVWIPCEVELSCCASACAAPSAVVCADRPLELVDSACNELVKLLSAVSSVPVPPGVPYRLCSWPEDIRDLVGITGAAGFGAQLVLNEQIELATGAGHLDG